MFNCQGRRYNVSETQSGQKQEDWVVLPGHDLTPDPGPSLVKMTS